MIPFRAASSLRRDVKSNLLSNLDAIREKIDCNVITSQSRDAPSSCFLRYNSNLPGKINRAFQSRVSLRIDIEKEPRDFFSLLSRTTIISFAGFSTRNESPKPRTFKAFARDSDRRDRHCFAALFENRYHEQEKILEILRLLKLSPKNPSRRSRGRLAVLPSNRYQKQKPPLGILTGRDFGTSGPLRGSKIGDRYRYRCRNRGRGIPLAGTSSGSSSVAGQVLRQGPPGSRASVPFAVRTCRWPALSSRPIGSRSRTRPAVSPASPASVCTRTCGRRYRTWSRCRCHRRRRPARTGSSADRRRCCRRRGGPAAIASRSSPSCSAVFSA